MNAGPGMDAGGRLAGRDIICIASQDWDSHLGVPQQIMARLAATNRVLYVNPPRSILRRAEIAARAGRLHTLHLDVAAARAVEVIDPPAVTWPVFNIPPAVAGPLRAMNGAVLGAWLRRQAARRGFAAPVLYIFAMQGAQLLGRVPAACTVYDCIDEWAGYETTGSRSWHNTRAMDEALCRGSDAVFVGSDHLAQLKTGLNPETHMVRHAADFAHFNTAAAATIEVPDDIAALPAPRVGLVGVLDKRVDLDILAHLAGARPDLSLVLIGPVLPNLDLSALTRRPNVHLLGMRTVPQLPAYIAGLDVCLIPYLIDDFTRNIYPLKLHEYLASGRPVVSTPVPACVAHADLVGIADTPAGFLAAVEAALADRAPERDAARIALARANDWEDRVAAKSAVIARLLATRGG